MLEEWPAARADDRRTAADSSTGPIASRSARRRRGLLRRSGIIMPAASVAALLVVVVTIASYLTSSKGNGAASLFQSINSLGTSHQVAALAQERQNIIAMYAATQTLTTAAKPTTADAAAILAAQAAPAGGGTATGGGTGVATIAPPANPTAAEALGKELLVSYGGFSSSQWDCLYSLWQRESGWNVYAENGASGAYGIPQSLPGDKMASIASDWQTNPATQIKWGLSYIKSTYGTPCAAWQNEVNYGYY
jgi:hypothetical protein